VQQIRNQSKHQNQNVVKVRPSTRSEAKEKARRSIKCDIITVNQSASPTTDSSSKFVDGALALAFAFFCLFHHDALIVIHILLLLLLLLLLLQL
jgi:hypothetical protein